MAENMYNGSLGTYTPDGLIAGDSIPVVIESVTIVSGAGALARGTVLGVITASGKYKTANSANSDGSQNGKCILTDAVDATSADVVAQVYVSGMFNSNKLIFGGSDTIAKHKDSLRQYGVFVKQTVQQ